MDEFLTQIGALGFFAVFQLVGAWGFRFSAEAVRKGVAEGTKGLNAVAGGLFTCAFSLAWSVLPLWAAHEMGGTGLLAAQVVVLVTLLAFVLVPVRSRGSADAPEPLPPAGPPEEQALEDPTAKRTWRHLVAAATPLAFAAAYAAVLLGRPLPGMTGDWLRLLVKVEFLVIHSFPFLAIITLPRLATLRWRSFQWFLFLSWLSLYMGFAVADKGGVAALAAFLAGTAGTYLGFILKTTGMRRLLELARRWFLCFLLFMVAAGVSGAEDWDSGGATLLHGLLYFTALAAVEFLGVHDMQWKRLLGSVLDRLPSRSAP